jgi:hypothetical protein
MPRFDRPGIASWGPDRVDVFVRSAKGALIHIWRQGATTMMLDMGGQLASRPVAVTRGERRLDVFARDTGQHLLWWTWSETDQALVGPQILPGLIATDPIAVSVGTDKIMVFAVSIDGPLRYWESSFDDLGVESFGRPQIKDENATWQPAIVSRSPSGVDVVVANGQSGAPEWWQLVDGDWQPPTVLRGMMNHPPVMLTSIASGNAPRLDVYARGEDGRLTHWGRGFFNAPGSPSGWFGPEASVPDPFATNPYPVSLGDSSVELLARSADNSLVHWSWDAHARSWNPLQPGGSAMASEPVGISCATDTMDVFAWGDETSLLHWSFASGTWASETWALSVVKPTPPQDELADGLADGPPDYLILRAVDHLLLGLSAPGFVAAADGKTLIAQGSDARLIVTFPPQHIVEGVLPLDAPPFPSTSISPARLSGPSRVGFVLATGAEVALSASGVLGAMRTAVVSTEAAVTRVEIPYGIAFTPDTAGHIFSAVHAADPLDIGGTTSLWRMELHAAHPAADLQLANLLAGRADSFEPPLDKADRFFIKRQATPAFAHELALTGLGGSLDATGRWPTFSWEHSAVLGRDQEVRTAVEGVLFPLGHRAIVEEVTRRSANEPTAVLRKSRQLVILEPVRRQADATVTPALLNAFPFEGVEITTRRFADLDDEKWRSVKREAITAAQAEDILAQINAQAQALEVAVYGDNMGYQGGDVVEDLAFDGNEAAVEFIGWRAASVMQQRNVDLISELGLDTEDVDVFFQPTVAGAAIRFPVRCFGESLDVHFDMPMWFVADVDLAGDLREPLHTLSDSKVLALLQQAHLDKQDGFVPLPGVPINLAPTVPAAERSAPVVTVQYQEVRRINIVGNALGGGFLPTLGLPRLPNVPGIPGDPQAWAAEVGMASLRSLLDSDPAVRIHYAADYVASGVSEVPFGIIGKVTGVDVVEDLALDFAKAKDKIGGLAAPNMVADGISRAHGLINVAAQLVSDTEDELDPHKLFAEGASLLGFDLRDLVTNITVPPEFTTLLLTGQPPTIKMNWSNIDLKRMPMTDPVFAPDPGSKLGITVLSSPTLNETTCELGGFALNMLPGEPLIEVHFASLKYQQILGQAPKLTVGGLTAKLVGKLALLQVLQDNVGLGDRLPKVNVTAMQADATFLLPVPDVEAFSFVMSNLMFSAGLTVPFTPMPVALRLGFATREKPFTLTVLMFGGGGYVDLELTYQGLRRLEISLQFGAAIALNFGIARAEVHAFGGIRYALLPDRSVTLTGFIHIGGSVELLGLVSVAVELQVELDYQSDNSLVGQAKLVIEVDLTLYSHRFELDSGEWRIFGGPPGHQRLARPSQRFMAALPVREDSAAGLDAWQAYRSNFA